MIRAAIYNRRISVEVPKTMGRIIGHVKINEDGVLIGLKPSKNGFSGSSIKYKDELRWRYEWYIKEGCELPQIGISQASIIHGSVDEGTILILLKEGQKVRQRKNKSEIVPVPTQLPIEWPKESFSDLGQLVSDINRWVDRMKGRLVLSLNDSGKLKALVEYGDE